MELSVAYQHIKVPNQGEKIEIDSQMRLKIPDQPVIPFIEGDGTGPDIWRATQHVLDTAVKKTYGGKRKIAWMEVYAGEKSCKVYGENQWLPNETLEAIQEYRVAIKGPLTTPVGGGIRSINVALRQELDLYVCLRPVRYFTGVPSPVKKPEDVDMVIFRENTEDIYAGIEWAAGSAEAAKVLAFLEKEFPAPMKKVRFGTQEKVNAWLKVLESVGGPKRELGVEVGVGLKPISRLGTERLVHSAIGYAIKHQRKNVTLVHKGNIMKFTEGAFRDWGYQVAREFYGAEPIDGGPWCKIPAGKPGAGIIIKDVIADAFLQQILLRPSEYDVVATPNLNGDYLSDALAAEVGGIGIAPGANINYLSGHAIFEATHGTAPKYANLDKVNPGSLILSGVMMLEHMGWNEAAQGIVNAVSKTISNKSVTYDFARLMDGAKEVKCSEFGKLLAEAI